jgi:excisionase family DNA binding protein
METNINKSKPMLTSPRLFDNLVPMEDLLAYLKHQYKRSTIYHWIDRNGMPHRKIRGRLWFSIDEVTEWLERS